ncbi:MAG: GNAT family N-acetyltransferase [Ktedonobacterales bacterium]
MSQDHEQIVVENNEAKQRYEAQVDGHLAVLTYERDGNNIIYLHTGVPSALAGRGIANQLARTALDDARIQQLTVVPLCPFVAAYIRRHQEYLELVDESQRSSLLKN